MRKIWVIALLFLTGCGVYLATPSEQCTPKYRQQRRQWLERFGRSEEEIQVALKKLDDYCAGRPDTSATRPFPPENPREARSYDECVDIRTHIAEVSHTEPDMDAIRQLCREEFPK